MPVLAKQSHTYTNTITHNDNEIKTHTQPHIKPGGKGKIAQEKGESCTKPKQLNRENSALCSPRKAEDFLFFSFVWVAFPKKSNIVVCVVIILCR